LLERKSSVVRKTFSIVRKKIVRYLYDFQNMFSLVRKFFRVKMMLVRNPVRKKRFKGGLANSFKSLRYSKSYKNSK